MNSLDLSIFEEEKRGFNEPDSSVKTRKITPYLPKKVIMKLVAFIETKLEEDKDGIANALRRLNENWKNESWSLELRTTALVIADLIDQGWEVNIVDNVIELAPPGLKVVGENVNDSKIRLRRALQIGRERQLTDPSVHRFLKRMSKPTRQFSGSYSVLDLVDRGDELSTELRAVADLPYLDRVEKLKKIIDPVVQVCDENARCSITGIRLLDIWRFFRHTWSLEYRSIPGRQMPLLIRNAARPCHPVIGIALFASPVLRTRPRDNWIGWVPEPFLERLHDSTWDTKLSLQSLQRRIEHSIDEIRWDDLVAPGEINHPTEKVVFRLEQRSAGAAAARTRFLQEKYNQEMESEGIARSQSDPAKHGKMDIDWREASEDLLFVRKRAETLSGLLLAKTVFQSINWRQDEEAIISSILRHPLGKRAISIALQEVRKAGLSSQVADLSICGAVTPYNELLGGKLVALLAASEEVRSIWRERYGNQVSLISSQMAGRPFYRPAELKLLTTTSLYGVGSSQYNRLKLKASKYPDIVNDINWTKLEELTAGYGTVHLSSDTVRTLREMSERQYGARRINNRFGEGTSPRLRQIREGLDALGIQSDSILKHEMPRLFYICPLIPDAREQLMEFHLSTHDSGPSLTSVFDSWCQRWLVQRIQNEEVMNRLSNLGPITVVNDLLPNDPFPVDQKGQYLLPFWS